MKKIDISLFYPQKTLALKLEMNGEIPTSPRLRRTGRFSGSPKPRLLSRVWGSFGNKVYECVRSLIIILPIAFIVRTYFYGLYKVPTGSMETTMLIGEYFLSDKLTPLFTPLKHGDIIAFNDPTYPYSDNYAINLFQRYVYGPINWTKRIIACPEDHIKGLMENGKPVMYLKKKGEADFSKLDEPYLNKYPIIAEYRPQCVSNSLSYYSYDPSKSYEEQPFYRLYEDEIQMARLLLARIDTQSILYPQTATYNKYGNNVDIFDVQLGKNQYWVMGDNRLGSADSRFHGPLDGTLIHGKIRFRLWSIDSDEAWVLFDIIKHPIEFWKRVRWNRWLQFIS